MLLLEVCQSVLPSRSRKNRCRCDPPDDLERRRRRCPTDVRCRAMPGRQFHRRLARGCRYAPRPVLPGNDRSSHCIQRSPGRSSSGLRVSFTMATVTGSPRGWEQSSENESDDEALPASAHRGDAAGKTELPSFFILEIVKKSVCTERTIWCVSASRSR